MDFVNSSNPNRVEPTKNIIIMCDGNLSMANSIEDEDNPFEGPFENCPECLNVLSDIEYDLQYCGCCGWDSEDNE